MLSNVRSLLLGSTGSFLIASKPAPIITPFLQASYKSSSFTQPPRAVLIKKAVGFIIAKVVLLTISLVTGVLGVWTDT